MLVAVGCSVAGGVGKGISDVRVRMVVEETWMLERGADGMVEVAAAKSWMTEEKTSLLLRCSWGLAMYCCDSSRPKSTFRE